MKSLCLATRNKHKVRELSEMLGPEWKVTSAADHPHVPEVEETGDTFEANARLKAEAVSNVVEGWVLADDSGLEVDALGGAPGVYSARYAGLPSNDAANNEKLLETLKTVGALQPENRRARFRCVLALARAGETLQVCHGTCEGTLALTLEGSHGFGYDLLFIPDGYSHSFGLLSEAVKATISHRSRALAGMNLWLKRH